MTVLSVIEITFLCWKRMLEAQHTGGGLEYIPNVTKSSNYIISENGRPKCSEIMPYISLQYHRQVPVSGPIFHWQGIEPARTWHSAATAGQALQTKWWAIGHYDIPQYIAITLY